MNIYLIYTYPTCISKTIHNVGVIKTNIGWVFEIVANTNQLSWLFLRFITMILKMECLVPIHSRFSTK
jgi:hypothetical protein